MVAVHGPRAMQLGVRGVFYLLDAAALGGAENQWRSRHGLYSGDAVAVSDAISATESAHDSGHGRFSTTASAVDKMFEYSTANLEFHSIDIGEEQRPPLTMHECSVSPHHTTRAYGRVRSLDFFGGPKLSPILPGSAGAIVVPASFVAILRNTGFSGLQFTEWPIACNQSSFLPPPLYHVDGTGKSFLFPREIVGGDNACGHCGYGPVICYECGDTLYRCPQCARQIFIMDTYHEGPGDPRIALISLKPDDRGCQVDAANWDGSDFVSFGDQLIVTRRVIDWLRRSNIAPWVAESLKAEFCSVSPAQLEAIQRAAGRNWPMVKKALTAHHRR